MHIVGQRKKGDCGIAALASYLHLPYEDVYATAVRLDPRCGKFGITMRNLVVVAGAFSRRLKIVRKPDLEEDCGVLRVNYSDGCGHFVVLRRGQIFDVDPPGAWDLEEYLKPKPSRQDTTGWLLTED